jgi:aspartyl aminopeptidase
MMPRFDRSHTEDLLAYLAASPSPYHAVENAGERLSAAGFRRLAEREAWDGAPGGRYLIRSGALIAWYVPEDAGPSCPFRVVGAHTDSPNLRIKPRPDTGACGWRQVAVEIYGAPLLNSWLDRDLGLAGRLVLREGGMRLVDVTRPLLRIPQLAVHLDRSVNDGLVLDRQRHMTPVWGLGEVQDGELIEFAAGEAGIAAGEVVGWDLMAHDVMPPAYLGRDRELIAAPRLDNLVSVHAPVRALTAVTEDGLPHGSAVPVVAALDHEETGSESATGARGPLLANVLDRLVSGRGGNPQDRARALAGTLCLSTDMGHAVHPNYPDWHEPGHHPVPNGGPILKVNVNQRFATDGIGWASFAAAAERAGLPWQPYAARNSVPCGSTIGPITAARLGVTTVDTGIAGLSLHSARELAGTDDPWMLAALIAAFLVG